MKQLGLGVEKGILWFVRVCVCVCFSFVVALNEWINKCPAERASLRCRSCGGTWPSAPCRAASTRVCTLRRTPDPGRCRSGPASARRWRRAIGPGRPAATRARRASPAVSDTKRRRCGPGATCFQSSFQSETLFYWLQNNLAALIECVNEEELRSR